MNSGPARYPDWPPNNCALYLQTHGGREGDRAGLNHQKLKTF